MEQRTRALLLRGVNHLPAVAAEFVSSIATGSSLPSAALGAAAMAIVNEAGEWACRHLSERQEARISHALGHALFAIDENARAGKMLRSELVDHESSRTDVAQEVLEAATASARDAFESKKVPFVGYAMANFAFAPNLAPEDMHRLLAIADKLTFRQFCILRAFAELPSERIVGDHRLDEIAKLNDALSSECEELQSLRLLTPYSTFQQPLVLVSLGRKFIDVFSLLRLEHADYSPILEVLLANARKTLEEE